MAPLLRASEAIGSSAWSAVGRDRHRSVGWRPTARAWVAAALVASDLGRLLRAGLLGRSLPALLTCSEAGFGMRRFQGGYDTAAETSRSPDTVYRDSTKIRVKAAIGPKGSRTAALISSSQSFPRIAFLAQTCGAHAEQP